MPSPSRALTCGIRALLTCAVAGAAMALLSCTPEQKHRTLTFFFDGVPPLHPVEKPDEKGAVPDQARKTVERPRLKEEIWSEHEPMKDKASCVTCHSATRSFSLLKPAAQLCLPCHEQETRQYPRMHGPSAVGDCGVCHDAHRAPRKHLVRAPVVQLCFRCHDRTPEGGETLGCSRASDEALCTECHNPHGGDKAYFLVTRPAESPPPARDGPPPGEEGQPK